MTEEKRPIGSRSYETQLLVDRLVKMTPDELISYDELSKIVGGGTKPGEKYYGRLMNARRVIETEHGIAVGPVAGVGIKRLNVDEQAAIAPASIKALRRASRRRLKRLAIVEYDKFDEQQRAQHNLAASAMGLFDFATRPKSLERLQGAVQQAAAKLNVGDTLRLFHVETNGSGSA